MTGGGDSVLPHDHHRHDRGPGSGRRGRRRRCRPRLLESRAQRQRGRADPVPDRAAAPARRPHPALPLHGRGQRGPLHRHAAGPPQRPGRPAVPRHHRDHRVPAHRQPAPRRRAQLAGAPTPEEVRAHIWGPWKFSADGRDDTGRTVAPQQMAIGEWTRYGLPPTTPPPWSTTTTGFVHFQRQRLSICFSSSWCSASRWVFTRNGSGSGFVVPTRWVTAGNEWDGVHRGRGVGPWCYRAISPAAVSRKPQASK
ncbi:hypothetical protein F558DRAFT_06245 [Streptomyces sp. AmelKG-A3]|nr:hypothetical protein GA0115247_13295 [Streptomyces sp. PalvLS-984]SDE43941.1 hypothetical protein F558DRAFT_06245 [Streptomyces sp. AmelKG-A3]